MKKNIITSISAILVFTVICGVLYTGIVTAIAQVAFPNKANGSIIEVDGKKYGTELLGQQFSNEKYMWGRIMNISFYEDENGKKQMCGVPSNLSPSSKEYEELVKKRVELIKSSHPKKGDTPIPVDLVTCSGSGLDPEISVAAANYQLERIAQNNQISVDDMKKIIEQCTKKRFMGVFGEERVNVLKVNLMLDGILK